jgi:HEAT repeat protein
MKAKTKVKTSPEQTVAKTGKEVEVTVILKQMAIVLRNLRTYQSNNPVLQKSFEGLFDLLTSFLAKAGSLTLLVRENEIFYGTNTVYATEDRMESLSFAMYRDGIRLISFRDGISRGELQEFMNALHEAREADPYQADLVTILWEKDLANISYRAVDAYLEDEDKKSIDEMAERVRNLSEDRPVGDIPPGSDFFTKELGLSLERKATSARRELRRVREADLRKISHEILEEEDRSLLRRCTDICLEILNLNPRDDTFDRVANFLVRICDWSVNSEDFLTACAILTDLRSLRDGPDLTEPRKASIDDSIDRLGEKRQIERLGTYLENVKEQRSDEIFAYLTMLSPAAVGPLCDLLADCEIRRVRYLLCRAISVIAKSQPMGLRHFLVDRRWYFVRNIVMILGMMGNPEGIQLLKQTMNHTEDRVRREVARSVGKIRNKDGLDILTGLITDDNKMVRFASLSAMRELDATEARELLEATIIDKSFGKKSMDEKREFMRTYGNLGKQGFGFLEAIIEGRYKHMDEEGRAAAVYGVAMVDDQETVELLRQIIEGMEGRIHRAALESVATLSTISL